MPQTSENSRALKILVVEDNALVAETIAEALIDGGYQVVGPASNLSAGLVLAQGEELDGALLDINLGGRLCFPIAWVLSERNVPFLFVTGYADTAMIPPELRSTWRLTKPFRIAELGAVAVKAFGTRAFGAS